MVYMLLGTGFEETEAIAPLDLLRRAGISVQTVGLNGTYIQGGHGITVETDIAAQDMILSDAEMIILPGGLGGVASIRGNEAAMNAIRFAYEHGRYVAAICAGPTILADLGITDGKIATCYPGCESQMGAAKCNSTVPCVRDGLVITGASAGCAIPFGLLLIEALKGAEAAAAIKQQIVLR